MTHTLCTPSDAALIASWRRRDDVHTGPLFLRFRRLVAWIASRFRMDPEDLFHDATVRALAWEGPRLAASVKAFGSWFSNIARFIALSEYRTLKRRSKRHEEIAYLSRPIPVSLIPEAA